MKRIFVIALLLSAVTLVGCGLNRPAPKPEAVRVSEGVTLDGRNIGYLSAGEVEAILNQIAAEQYVTPISACFDEKGVVVDGRTGRRLNAAATMTQVMASPPNSHVSSVYQDIFPAINADVLKKARKVSSYTTPIVNDHPDRIHNIKLTAKLINNSILEPGSEFSFNSITGEPTADRGFRKATIFAADGRHEQGIGGGMCQVSSTLYNAVLEAKLTVTERHPHSQPVNYVPVNRDATTYTDKDFRFINSTRRPIMIRSFVAEKQLRVDLLTIG
ncbi:hypothetical protein SDC9_22947 [bioreactor metagenome]|uniref:Vancomycin B-type resistance protein VanW n=1 Tax=bioreactor metagenome TaxID=1076179 RepID=A0A644UDM7_9ZZZZ|nr:VanW family protein [Negativicutes bacterium]